MRHGNIKEQKDVANLNKGKEAGWDMAKLDEEKAAEESKAGAKAPAGKKAFGEGTTWQRPTFGRKAPTGSTKFGGGDFAALDELDDEDSGKKKNTAAKPEAKTEVREEKKSAPVKPTFRGRMNLTKTGGGGQDDQAGVGKAYDFQVHHATPGDQREHGGEQKQRRPRKDKGVDLDAKLAQDADDDGDFTIVRNKEKKRFARRPSNSSSDDDVNQGRGRGGGNIRGARVERGGNRGGRGGFFKSSNVKKQD